MLRRSNDVEELLATIKEIEEKLNKPFGTPLDEKVLIAPPEFELVKRIHGEVLKLPPPDLSLASRPFAEVVKRRRTVRSFDPEASLTLSELSTLLYLTCGTTLFVDGIYGFRDYPLRAAPSAGALNGVDLYVIPLRPTDELRLGVYYYNYVEHALVRYLDVNTATSVYYLMDLSQPFAFDAPLLIAIVANLKRGLWKYGIRYYKYALLDAGIVAENCHLAATAMGLCSVMIAGFRVDALKRLLDLHDYEIPALVVAIGKPRR